jgi:hypothetical protein
MKLELKKASDVKVGDMVLISHNKTVDWNNIIIAVKIAFIKNIPASRVFGMKFEPKVHLHYEMDDKDFKNDVLNLNDLIPVCVQE